MSFLTMTNKYAIHCAGRYFCYTHYFNSTFSSILRICALFFEKSNFSIIKGKRENFLRKKNRCGYFWYKWNDMYKTQKRISSFIRIHLLDLSSWVLNNLKEESKSNLLGRRKLRFYLLFVLKWLFVKSHFNSKLPALIEQNHLIHSKSLWVCLISTLSSFVEPFHRFGLSADIFSCFVQILCTF